MHANTCNNTSQSSYSTHYVHCSEHSKVIINSFNPHYSSHAKAEVLGGWKPTQPPQDRPMLPGSHSYQLHWTTPCKKTQKGCSPPQKPPLLPAFGGFFQKWENSRELFFCRLIQDRFSISSLKNELRCSSPSTWLVLTHKLWSPRGACREA